ncbi:LysM peptidoglycan-binding domain-containing protein [Rhodopseudomonas sp. BAL398]|nr:LysM peptidoglycan-binding domain-containing protein [Rhodopseudomonas sp. BAL398]WOK19753.1 LysM peptidoglycan-binding domain-containing protein [Rhodopseudomonas sp. BAL398]
MMKANIAIIAVAASLAGSAVAHAKTPCGDTTKVERGDSLSSIAERCDISEGTLLQANPNIDGSGDLRVGATVNTTTMANRTGDRLRSFAHGVSSGISRLASEVGSSVDDLLDKNPDLKQRLSSVGDKLTGESVTRKIKLTMTPQQGPTGANVDLAVSGLPAKAAVVIGAGRPGQSYTVLDHAKASEDGTINAKLAVPTWASAKQDLVFVVAADDGDWTIRSAKFDVQ